MDTPMDPLQRLLQQPLESPTGARLVLKSSDAGYPDTDSPRRGRWFDNIASTDTETFLRASNADRSSWHWPAVVLTPEEYKLRVGRMSMPELRRQLEKYWGRGGIPGAPGYQDTWVPAWAPDNTRNPYELTWISDMLKAPALLDATMFSLWVNRECGQWLRFLIAENHTLGVVHAWFAAFMGVLRTCLGEVAESFTNMPQVHHPKSQELTAAILRLKFRMSFDVCMANYNKVVDGLPSLPLHTEITTNEKGMLVINNSIENMFPRRIWDICANTVIPATWFCGPPCPLTRRLLVGPLGVKPVSHAWVADGDLTFIATEANQGL